MTSLRRLALVALAALLGGGTYVADAGPGGCTSSPSLTVFASETITVSSTALGFTSTVAYPNGALPAELAVCNVRGDSISSTTNGTTPTSSVGAQTTAPGYFSVCGEVNVKRFRMIRVTTDATVYCEYSREGDN